MCFRLAAIFVWCETRRCEVVNYLGLRGQRFSNELAVAATRFFFFFYSCTFLAAERERATGLVCMFGSLAVESTPPGVFLRLPARCESVGHWLTSRLTVWLWLPRCHRSVRGVYSSRCYRWCWLLFHLFFFFFLFFLVFVRLWPVQVAAQH